MDGLRDRFRVIVPDARRHGASAAPEGAYTLDRLGRDALALLDHAGMDVAHVCGISMGGLVAQWLAIEAPARVGRLVLANTASRIGSVASWQEREAVVRDQGLAAIADTVLARFFGAAFRSARPAVVARFRERLLSTPAQGYAGCCAALREADLSAQSDGIACRTLVIAGDEDVSTPPALSQALAAAIPGARLLVLPASHLSNVEQEAAFSGALFEHLMAPEAA